MNRDTRIKQKLDVLKPHYLEIIDDSASHASHADISSGQTHITIKIYAESLNEKSLVAQHRIIQDLIKDEFDSGLHALSIKVLKKLP